jgi:hypothetical protein
VFAAPPEPTVTVIAEPVATAYPAAVNNPPAPPPPPFPPPPPATTKYSTVEGGAAAGTKDIVPLVVQVYILYPPATVIVGLPVVLVGSAYVSR